MRCWTLGCRTAVVCRRTVTADSCDSYPESTQKKYATPAGFNHIWKKGEPAQAPSLRGEVMKVLSISGRPISAHQIGADSYSGEIMSVPESAPGQGARGTAPSPPSSRSLAHTRRREDGDLGHHMVCIEDRRVATTYPIDTLTLFDHLNFRDRMKEANTQGSERPSRCGYRRRQRSPVRQSRGSPSFTSPAAS